MYIKEALFNKNTQYIILSSIIIAHFFIAIGRNGPFYYLFLNPAYYPDLFFVTIIVCSLILYIRSVWIRLNPHDLPDNFSRKKILHLLFSGIFTPSVFSIILVYIYMDQILDQDIFVTTYFYYELPISIVVIVAINLVFGIIHLTGNIRSIPPSSDIGKSPPLIFQSGKNKITVYPEQIMLVEKQDTLCFIYTTTNEKYIHYGALRELASLLQYESFFRANRQIIIRRQNCLEFETQRSGRLILSLKVPDKHQISISQKRAREFKAWLTPPPG